MLPRSDTYRPSKNFRISLLRTLQICWMSAALWETSSRDYCVLAEKRKRKASSALTLPQSCSSSLVFFDASTSTPGLIMTFRTSFSPMKFLISTSHWSVSLFFSRLTLIGKLKELAQVQYRQSEWCECATRPACPEQIRPCLGK
jgi:hypothetical protein